MSNNPYKYIATANMEPVSGNKKISFASASGASHSQSKSALPLVNDSGEINAYDKQDLMRGIAALGSAARRGEIVKSYEKNSPLTPDWDSHVEEIRAALTDKDIYGSFQALGEVMTDEINESMGREGFARNILGVKPLGQGEVNQTPVFMKDVRCFYASSHPMVVSSEIQNSIIKPPEFYLTGSVKLEEKTIAQDPTGKLMQVKYNDALEQLMVQEDRITINVANTACSAINDQFTFTTFTPTVMQHMKAEVGGQGGIPPRKALISYDIWNDLVAEPEFANYWSQIEKHELALEGNLGQINGMDIITDGFRIPNLRAMPDGQVYIFGPAQLLGQVAQRGNTSVQATTGANTNEPTRGWFFSTIESIVIGNPRACVHGQRG